MSAGISLESSIRTCKVVTGWADKVQSSRFQDPNSQICLMWDGTNSKNQIVHPDSFYTKSAGCNSALDRVAVENNLRPSYMEYITLNAGGIKLGYESMNRDGVNQRGIQLKDGLNQTGQFGYGAGNTNTKPTCKKTHEGFAKINTAGRNMLNLNHKQHRQQSRTRAGM